MRVAVIVLVAFVVLYVCVAGVGVAHHGSESTPTAADRPALPSFVKNAWAIAPPFLKVGASDVVVSGASFNTTTATLRIAGSATATIFVAPATQWYQPERLVQLRYRSPIFGTVGLTYPPIAATSSSATPQPLAPGNLTQTIVLPKTGGAVSVTCESVLPCAVTL